MSRKTRIASAVLTFALLSAVATAVTLIPGESRVGATGSIDLTGAVSGPTGNEPGVSVYVTDTGSSTVDYGPTTTASDGTYVLPVAAGTYDLHFDPPTGSGLNSAVDSSVVVVGSQTINEELTQVAHTVSGYVTDTEGNPFPGVRVFLGTSQGTIASGLTDTTGHFSVTAPAGVYRISLSISNSTMTVSNISPQGLAVDLTSSDQTQDFTLRTALLSVTVKDTSGSPEPNVIVGYSTGLGRATVGSAGSDYSENDVSANGESTTGADGVAVLEVLDGLEFANGDAICAFLANHIQTCDTNDITIAGNTSIELDAPVTYTFSGILTDSDGDPVSDSTLVQLIGSAQGSGNTGFTDANGHFSIVAPAGSYTLGINKQGVTNNGLGEFDMADASDSIVNLTNGNVTQNFTINTVPMSITVEDSSGNPEPNASVEYNSGPSNTTVSSDGENYSFGSGTEVIGQGTTNANGVAVIPMLQGADFKAADGHSICVTFADGSKACSVGDITATASVNLTFREGRGELVAPSAPTHLTAATSTNQPPHLSWDAVSGASFYDVYRDGTLIDTISASNTVYSDELALEGVGSYYVTAANDVGESDPSNTISVVYDVTPPTTDIPIWSSNPVVSGGDTTLAVPAVDNLSGVQTGEYYLGSSDPGQGNGVAMIYDSATGVLAASVDSNLSPGIYTLHFRAEDNAGNWSDVSSTTLVVNQPIPSAPTNLTAVTPTTQYPLLSWSGVDSADSYNIYRDGVMIDSVSAISYTDSTATQGAYNYYVTAVNSSGESAPSNTVTVAYSAIGSPSITAATPTNQSPSLSWDGADDAASYNIYRAGTKVDSTTDTSYVDSSVTQGSYSYYVTAVDASGDESFPSNTLTVVYDTTGPTVTITAPTVSAVVQGTSVTISGAATDNLSSVQNSRVVVHLRAILADGKLGAFLNTLNVPVNPIRHVWSVTFDSTAFPDGQYGITVLANDNAGNSQTAVGGASLKPFTIDNTKPTVSFTTPTSFAGPFTAGPVVTITVSDGTGSGLATMAIHVYNSSNQLLTTCGGATPAQLAAGTMSCDTSSLAPGTYYVKAGATDDAGHNQTILSSSFIVTG